VHGLPDRVRDVVETRGGGVRGLIKGPGYFLRGKRSIVLVAYEAEDQGRWGFRGGKILKERFCYFGWIRGLWQVQDPLRWAAKYEPFGRPEAVWGGRG